MNGEDVERNVEELLRAAGPPLDPPPHLTELARRSALGSSTRAGGVVHLPAFLDRRRFRVLSAGAVAAVAAAAAIVVSIALRGPTPARTISLAGAGPARAATASLQIGQPDNGVRQLVFTVENLPPAPQGRFYQMWISNGRRDVSAFTFNTASSGHSKVEAVMPAAMGWKSCWVTMERYSGGKAVPVLQSS